MSNCSYLDPASLLAQSAVSIRLGRRASSCSHTLLATARRRAPLNESSVQVSIKQSSTAASAPTQVLQSVGLEPHLGRREVEATNGTVDRVLSPGHGEQRRRARPFSRDGPLQAAVESTAEPLAEELAPPLHGDSAEQPSPERLQACGGHPNGPSALRNGLLWGPASGFPPDELAPQCATKAAILQPVHKHDRKVGEPLQHQHETGPPNPVMTAPAQQAGLRHRSRQPIGHAAAAQQEPHQPLRPRPLAADWGQSGDQLQLSGAAVATAAAATVAVVEAQVDADPAADTWPARQTLGPPAPTAQVRPGVSYARSSPPSLAANATAAAVQCSSAGALPNTATADRPPSEPGDAGGGSTRAMPPRPPGDPPILPEQPIGGQWGGLESQLQACQSCHSVQRFLQLMGPRVDPELMGSAIVHLSHLVSEELPDGDMERQLLAGLLDELTQRLRGNVRQLRHGLLAAVVCGMSRLRCFDGPLLREAAATAREAAAELTARQTAGLVWSFGRYHRDFGLRLEPDWSAALLHGVLPRLDQAKPQDVAMMLYGTALLREPPPPAARAALLSASLRIMPAASGPELSMSIWAFATLRLHPGREWLLAFLDRCDAATRTFVSGAAISNVLFGLATMRVQPPAPWMLNFLWQAQRRMNDMDAQSLVMLGWSLGRMRYRPDRKWLTRFFRYTRATVLLQPPDDLCGARGGSALQMQHQQHQHQLSFGQQAAASNRQLELWRRQQHRMQQRIRQRPQLQQLDLWADGNAAAAGGCAPLSATAAAAVAPRRHLSGGSDALPALPPQAYNVLLWACVRLSCRPMGTWLPLLCNAVQPRLSDWAPNELSALLWSLARLSWRPRDDWMTEFCAAARSGLPRFQPPDCVMALIALSRLCSGLGYRVSDGDMASALAQRLAPYYPRLQTTTLISVLLAMSRITPRVRAARLEEALAALMERVESIGVAVSVVSGKGSGAAGDVAAAAAAQPPLPPQEKEGVPEQLQPPPTAVAGPAASASASAAPAAALPPLTSRECANAVFAIGCVAVWPGCNGAIRGLCDRLLQELLPRAFRLATHGSFNGVDLVLLIHGVAMSRSRVSPQWLRRHEECALAVLRAEGLRLEQLGELHRAYHALDYRPELLPAPGAGPLASGGVGRGFGGAELGISTDGAIRGGGSSSGRGNGAGDPGIGGSAGNAGLRADEDLGAGVGAVSEGGARRRAELGEAARARRRRAAQRRRRRVTAAIERRVAEARRKTAAVELSRRNAKLASHQQQPQRQGAVDAASEHVEGDAALGSDGSDELEAAMWFLRLRRLAIQRFTAAARRGPRGAPCSTARSPAGNGSSGGVSDASAAAGAASSASEPAGRRQAARFGRRVARASAPVLGDEDNATAASLPGT